MALGNYEFPHVLNQIINKQAINLVRRAGIKNSLPVTSIQKKEEVPQKLFALVTHSKPIPLPKTSGKLSPASTPLSFDFSEMDKFPERTGDSSLQQGRVRVQ